MIYRYEQLQEDDIHMCQKPDWADLLRGDSAALYFSGSRTRN